MKKIGEESHSRAGKRRRMVAILAPTTLLAIAAGSYVVLKPDQVVAAGIGCYSSASEISSNVTVVATTGGDPVKVCRQLWASGDITGSSQAPDLTACVNSGGGVAVFPTGDDDVCSRLGLQPLPHGYRDAADRFARLGDDVHRQLYKTGLSTGASESEICLDEETALETVQDVLDKHRFTDWTAEIRRGDYQDRRCMNEVGFEDEDKTVFIIPSEPGMIPWHKDPTM